MLRNDKVKRNGTLAKPCRFKTNECWRMMEGNATLHPKKS